MGNYTSTGPFTNGAAPGISATFLNNMETWINQTEGDNGVVTLNGTTSGTCKMYQVLQGTIKATFFWMNNYNNTTGVRQQMTFPTAYTQGAMIWVDYFGTPSTSKGIYLLTGGGGGTHLTLNTNTTGGNFTTAQQLLSGSWGQANSAFDTFEIDGSYSGAVGTGFCFILGI